jgi:hypothetical protein
VLHQRLLNLDRRAHRLQRAAELDQKAIAGDFDFTPAVLRKERSELLLVLME